MSSVIISGDTSGAITLAAPAVSGTNTLTLQAGTATNSMNTLSTAVASTSGTSIDFTSLPAWVKKITVMFSGVSTNGTSLPQIQIGSGSVTTTGYLGSGGLGPTFGASTSTTGFSLTNSWSTSAVIHGKAEICLLSGNVYVFSFVAGRSDTGSLLWGGGSSPALGGALDRVRITTVNGTDTFDAGTINILYEG